MQIKNLSKGSRCYFPVFMKGANLSVGDLHFSQGDGEMSFCGAIEMVRSFPIIFGVAHGSNVLGRYHHLQLQHHQGRRREVRTEATYIPCAYIGLIFSLRASIIDLDDGAMDSRPQSIPCTPRSWSLRVSALTCVCSLNEMLLLASSFNLYTDGDGKQYDMDA